jgi:two-component system NtrC family sensor kinase
MIFRNRALGIALVYAVLGCLWILYSDAAVEAMARDSSALTQLQTWKGFAFVAVTALLIYVLVRAALRSEMKIARSLRSADERLRLVLDTIPSRVLWKDRAGRYLGGNRHFAADAGVQEPDQLVGLTDAAMPWRDQLERIRQSDDQILSGQRATLEYEVTLRGADGRPRYEVVTKVPLREANGEISGVLASYEDVTARKVAERQLRHSQKLLAIGELTNSVTHDFKNVLSVIIANAELVSRSLPPDSEEAVAMADLLTSSHNAVGMVRKLLGFSRQGDLMLGALDLRPVVRDLAPMLSRLLAGQYRLDVVVAPELPNVLADPDAVEQMLLNLISNARDAMPDGGEIRIRVHGPTSVWDGDEPGAPPVHVLGLDESPAPGHYVVIQVGDTGVGMEPEVAERIFEPYYTTKPTGQGTGLGLSMVYGLMRQHRGFVTLRTAPGQGALFSLYFPVLAADAEARKRRRLPAIGQLPRGTETVLLVDDQDELRRTGSRVLRRFGYTVVEAAHGAEALELLRRPGHGISLVLTDYIMPEMNGMVLIERIRDLGLPVKVALSSGHVDVGEGELAGDALTVPVIGKPWTMEELVTGVREVLDGVRS